ncbi:hypothetical protein [endosymbiont GvMRE of Glomus versiforme]|uniref:hypothetical protein n=1 Tax=endosymbiont GvMRE of Glomus versiforme TaxID=2039283 RepID=UPI000ECF7631|nr:hypothetical protein [endosymbiont GvMRE of Glomus versiforme]RHZ36930.1 hypothetical protein GvMRE_I2g320 [endosymbiont GvMRE of Glomus versiforme]
MNKHFSFNLVSPSGIALPDTWNEDGKKYLTFFVFSEVDITNENYVNYGKKTKKHLFLAGNKGAIIPYLIIPDDNSAIVNKIKNRKKDDIFITSLENLQFKPNFMDEYEGKGRQPAYANGFLVKDTSKLEKQTSSDYSFPEITFKAINQRKLGFVIGLNYEESFSKYGSYKHELEIKPLNLGIEGMPPITKIIFGFSYPVQTPLYTPLTKSKLYKSNILTESVGKTFTMRIKSLELSQNNSALSFYCDHDFEWDSFQEVEEQPSKNNKTETDSQTGESNNSAKANKGLSTGAKIGIATGIFLVVLVVISIFYYKSKKR